MESDLEAYRVWYPPVRSSLLCLSKLYGCLDPKIFNGLAQDAVHAATVCVQVSISCTPQLRTWCLLPSCVKLHEMQFDTQLRGWRISGSCQVGQAACL